MGASGLEVAHIFRRYGPEFREKHRGQLPRRHLRVMWAIESCRTAALGGRLEECDHCGARRVVYHSCRNRHCPKCQNLDKERWLDERRRELLPVPYFHVVFTIPSELNPIVLRNQKALYDLLFRCASQTLLTVAADRRHLGAQIGVLAILHTWGQQLIDHPHLHCIVPAGGLSLSGRRWVSCRQRFFLPVRVLSRLFRRKVLEALRAQVEAGELGFPGAIQHLGQPGAFQALIESLARREWVVYCKPPFGGPEQALEYLARYTHRVAITNERLRRLEDDHVVFTYKAYAHGEQVREMKLPAEEFIRRFLLHVLPERFVRIRSYGLLANRHRGRAIALCRDLLSRTPPAQPLDQAREGWRELLQRLTGTDPSVCPTCRQGHLHPLGELSPSELATETARPRPPPAGIRCVP